MGVANFDSSLISDSTPANQIDNKIMALLGEVVKVLAPTTADDGADWSTDHDVLKPIFDFYESAANEGYFSTVRMRGDTTHNGVRIRDMVNNEEFRIFVADVGGTPTLKIQHYSGAEQDSPTWTDILKIDATDIWHAGAMGNIQDYIDAAVAAAGAVTSVTGSGVISVSPTTGACVVSVNPAGGSNGQSIQLSGGVPGWYDQALPAHAYCVSVLNAPANGIQLPLSIGAVRGGIALDAGLDDIDIPANGYYEIAIDASFEVNATGLAVLTIRKGSTGISRSQTVYHGANQAISISCRVIEYLTSSDYVNFYLSMGSGASVVGVADITITRIS